MLTRQLITRRASDDGVDAPTAERDYVLAHVVGQLHRAKPEDGGRLVFKGGTSLRLVYFEQYRYSADLDFTVVGGRIDAALAALAKVVAAAKEHAEFPHLELVEAQPHRLDYIGPLGAREPRSVKVDLSGDEYVESIAQRGILPIWADLPEAAVLDIYPLEEITAEKLRCVMQRSQCRDLYDLYRLTEDKGMHLEDLRPLFDAKAVAKHLDPGTFAEKFEERIERYRRAWLGEMARHLVEPPPFGEVERIVRRHLRGAGYLTT